VNKAITEYQTLVFDCDGVVLNSNRIKTDAFYEATKHYGHEPALALKNYHVANGGISRYHKFEYFVTNILQASVELSLLDDLLGRFAKIVKQGVGECEIATGLEELREKTSQANWLIVSGSDQAELREVFKERGLKDYFNGGIFGSPDDKGTILSREIKGQNIHSSALFLGDSKYDYKVANEAGIDFCFLSNWTEVNDWKAWLAENDLKSCQNISDLIKL